MHSFEGGIQGVGLRPGRADGGPLLGDAAGGCVSREGGFSTDCRAGRSGRNHFVSCHGIAVAVTIRWVATILTPPTISAPVLGFAAGYFKANATRALSVPVMSGIMNQAASRC